MRKNQILLTACWLCCGIATAQVTIDIDANQRGPKISPTHYGIFFEDINHAADGGLYAELIRNRSFEDGQRRQVRERRLLGHQRRAGTYLQA